MLAKVTSVRTTATFCLISQNNKPEGLLTTAAL